MKNLTFSILTVAVFASPSLSAANLMINLRSTSANGAASGDVAAPYLTMSPGHDAGDIPLGESSWNDLASTGAGGSLIYSNGAAATGVILTFGTETVTGGGTIDLASVAGINTASLYGNGGGTPGQQSLVGNADAIYGNGNNSSNSAVGRSGWFGGGTGTAGNAVGLRVDGLTAGDYRIYLMARNTNSNAASVPMNLYSTTGALSTTFDFSLLTSAVQANTGFPNTNPTAYNAFEDGVNYVAFDLTLSAGQSLFIASDGGSAIETRGFLNMVQIVSVPEPSVCLSGLFGLVIFLRRRR